MNKKELIKSMSEVSGLNQTDSEVAFNALIHCLTDLLTKGDAIVLPGFVSLSVKDKPARTGRNPATGTPLNIPASKSVSVKISGKLKKAVNSQGV